MSSDGFLLNKSNVRMPVTIIITAYGIEEVAGNSIKRAPTNDERLNCNAPSAAAAVPAMAANGSRAGEAQAPITNMAPVQAMTIENRNPNRLRFIKYSSKSMLAPPKSINRIPQKIVACIPI